MSSRSGGRGAGGSAALEFVVLAPMLVLLVLFVLWAGRSGRAGLVADLAAEEAATVAALCCEEGDTEGRERVVAEVLAARPGLDFLCIGGVRPSGERFVSESSVYFDPSDGGSVGGVGVLGVGVECETDGAVAPLRGLFPEVTFEGRAAEVVRLSSPLGSSGLPTLQVDDARASEGDGFATFDVWLHQPQSADVSVSWWVVAQAGQATAGVDYAIVSGVVTVFSGDRTAEVRVPLIDDTLDEPEETFLLVLGNPSGVSLDRLAAVGTITDNDPPVGIGVVGTTVDEGEVGSPGRVEFVVSLDKVSGQVVRFDYETADGTAVAGADYVPARGSAQITPGATEFRIAVRLVGDVVHEAHEYFSLRVFNVMHALPSSLSAQGSVLDDDPPVLRISDGFGVEGGGPIVFRVGLTALRDPSDPVSFVYETLPRGGSATAGASCLSPGVDFVEMPRTSQNIPSAAPWVASVAVNICGDDGVPEGPDGETFALQLYSASGAKLPAEISGDANDNIATGTILDPDAMPRVFVDDVNALENAGSMVFLVRLSHTTSVDVDVTVRTEADSAAAGADYSAQARTVRITAGEVSAEFAVPLIDDNVQESAESFRVVLSAPTGGAILGPDADAVGTILDDDGPPLVSVAGPVRIPEGDTGAFVVSLSWPSASPIVVPFGFVDGTATEGDDYAAVPSTMTAVTIPAGDVVGRIPVRAVADLLDESDEEDFTVVLGAVTGGIVTVPTAAGVIEDRDDPPELTVTFENTMVIDATDAVEEGTDAEFTLALSKPSGRAVSVEIWTQEPRIPPNPATEGDDYDEIDPPQTVTFTPPETTKTVSVRTVDDALDELDVEVFLLVLQAVDANAVQIPNDRTTAGIGDNDDPPTVTVRAKNVPATVTEGEAAEFVIELSAVSGREVTVPVSTVDGTAVVDEDYTALDRDVRIAPGRGVGTGAVSVLVDTEDDEEGENDETFSLQLSQPTNAELGDPSSAEMTILDDDLSVGVENAEAREGDAVEFTLRLNGPAPPGGVTVNVSTRDLFVGTDLATAGDDYAARSNVTVPVAAGFETATFTVQTNRDDDIEVDERFQVRLVSAMGASINGEFAVGTIVNDDTEVSITGSEADEGDPVEFTVRLRPALSDLLGDVLDVVVGYATEPTGGDGAATAGDDYTPRTDTVRVPASLTDASFTVQTLPDDLDEADETFLVRLANPTVGQLAASPTATGTIHDDDEAPLLRINDPAAVTEGGQITFTITLDDPSGRDVTFEARTVRLYADPDAATPGDDYTPRQADLTITPGFTSTTFTVTTLDDALDEADLEPFRVRLRPTTPGDDAVRFGDSTGIGQVADDDDPPTLTVAADTERVTEGEIAHFTITLSGAGGREVTARARTFDGSAASGDDYLFTSRLIQFPPGAGDRTVTVSVPTIDDTEGEADETFRLALVGTENAVASEAATVTIADDDVELSIANAEAVEGDPLRFFVTLNASPTQEVTVDWATRDLTGDGAATSSGADYDYTAGSGTLTFPPGAETLIITIASRADSLAEIDEQFQIVLTNPTNARIGKRLATGTIIDGGPRLLTLTGGTATEGDDLTFTLTLDRPRNEPTTPTLRPIEEGGRVGLVRLTAVASPGIDYTLPADSAAYTIPARASSTTFTVSTVDDDADEPDEHVILAFDAPAGTNSDGIPGIGTIRDNDATPTLSVTGVDVAEGDVATFTVTLSAPSGGRVSVLAATVPGTAIAGADYTYYLRRLDFAPGVQERTIRVATTEDTVVESDETFQLQLTAPHNATLALAAATAIIRDDDTGLSIADAEAVEGDPLRFIVTLAPPRATQVQVNFWSRDGTGDNAAIEGEDYARRRATLYFSAGQTTHIVQVATLSDTETEGYEHLTAELESAVGATIVDGTAAGTILDAGTTLPVLTIDPVTVEEGGTAEIVLTLDRPSRDDIALSFTNWNTGTATQGIDFNRRTVNVVIPAGKTRAVVYAPTLEDELDENDETMTFLYFGLRDYYNAGVVPSNGIWTLVTILDDDPTPTVSVEGPDEVTEGQVATFVVRLSKPSGLPTSVWARTVAGSATAPGDYFERARRLEFRQAGGSPGVAELVVAVPTVDDAVAEAVETFTLQLSLPLDLTPGVMEAEVTVVDDDVSVGVGDASALEGESLRFDVELSAPSREDVTVSWQVQVMSVADAASDADFDADASGTVTILAGDESASFTVDSLSDEVVEGDERFQVRLSNAAGAPLGDAIDIGTIVDDDTTVSVEAASASEGAPVGFVVRLSEPLTRPVTVGYATEDLSVADAATAGDDYVAVDAGEVTVPAGLTEATVWVQTLSDDQDEPDERFGLRLSSTSLGDLVENPTAVGTIVDEALPVLSVDGGLALVTEGGSAPFTLRLSAASSEDVTVRVSTASHPGSLEATPGEDFEELSEFEVTITAGQTEAAVTVQTIDDTADEFDVEHFWVDLLPLDADAAAVLGDRRARGSIGDNDDAPTLTVTAPSQVTEGETVTFTLGLSETSQRPIVAGYVTAGLAEGPTVWAATPTRVACADVPIDARGDFEDATGTVTFAAGDQQTTVTVNTCDDATTEGDGSPARGGIVEALALNARLRDLGSVDAVDTVATVRILDNDPLPALTIEDAQALEGEDLVFTLRLNRRSELPTAIIEFDATISDPRVQSLIDPDTGRAVPPGDYSLVPRPVWFTFPNTTAEYRVQTHRNHGNSGFFRSERPAEVFGLVVAATQNIADTDPIGIGTIIDRPLQSLTIGLDLDRTFIEGQADSVSVQIRLSDSTIGPLDADLVLHYWTEESDDRVQGITGNFGSIYYVYANVAAQQGLDYPGVPRSDGATVTIPAGTSEVSFPLEIYDDEELESFEHFVVHVDEAASNTAPVAGLPLSLRIGMYDNESMWLELVHDPSDPAQGTTYSEGDRIRLTPRLHWFHSVHPDGSPALPGPLALTFALARSSGAPARDDDLELPEVVISGGSGPFASFEIPIVDDSADESTECFRLRPVPGEGMMVLGDEEVPFGLWFTLGNTFCIQDDD